MAENSSRTEMTAGQKLRQFRDYDLAGTLTVLAVAALIIFMVSRLLLPQKEAVLRVAVFDTELSDEAKEQLCRDVRAELDLPDDAEIEVDSGYVSANTNEFARLSILAADGEVDLVIAGREAFGELAGYGYFKDLSRYLPDEMQAEYASALQRFAYKSDAVADDAQQQGEMADGEYPFGLSLRGSGLWNAMTKDSQLALEDPVMGVILESDNDTNVLGMIHVMMK